MSVRIEYVVIGNKMRMQVPYALNPIFRSFFKTATWNSIGKYYEGAHTVQNVKKWECFLAASEKPAEKLTELDEVEATAEMLESAAQEAKRTLQYIEGRVKELNHRTEQARKCAAELKPQVDAAHFLLSAVVEEAALAEKELDEALKPVLALYERHGLDEILERFSYAASRGYPAKQTFGFAQEALAGLTKDMRALGFRCDALDGLVGVSLNRHDKLPDLLERAREQFKTGVQVYEKELED